MLSAVTQTLSGTKLNLLDLSGRLSVSLSVSHSISLSDSLLLSSTFSLSLSHIQPLKCELCISRLIWNMMPVEIVIINDSQIVDRVLLLARMWWWRWQACILGVCMCRCVCVYVCVCGCQFEITRHMIFLVLTGILCFFLSFFLSGLWNALFVSLSRLSGMLRVPTINKTKDWVFSWTQSLAWITYKVALAKVYDISEYYLSLTIRALNEKKNIYFNS